MENLAMSYNKRKLERAMINYAAFFMLVISSTFSLADPNIKQIHPDEPATFTHDIRFSASEAITALQLIKDSLDSFKNITEMAAAEKPIILSDHKNTDWETQNIGFGNAIITIEGALKKQNYLSKKVKYLEAVCNTKSGSSTDVAIINSLKKELQKAEEEYSGFLEKTILRD